MAASGPVLSLTVAFDGSGHTRCAEAAVRIRANEANPDAERTH
jgi:hypothetical protein